MKTAQIANLSTDQIQALTSADVGALTATQMPGLSTDQVVALMTGQIANLSATSVAALNSAQILAIEAQDIVALTTKQMAALKATQVQAFSTDQINALSSSQLSALSVTGITGLGSAQISVLDASDIDALTVKQIAALKTSQILAFSTDQLAALNTSQIASLTKFQVKALSSTQVAAINTSQVPHLTLGTPIILDLNGDGVKTLGISEGVTFDLFAEGARINTGWVSAGDGLLIFDRNHDSVINDGSELFGSATRLASGDLAENGYAALRELDSNLDGLITGDDAAFDDLQVWIDKNSDGISHSSELQTLATLGIVKIGLEATAGTDTDNGNLVGLTSTYETSDGNTHAAADVWFVADRYNSADQDMPSRVAGLAQAISSFENPESIASQFSGPAQEATIGVGFKPMASPPKATGLTDALNEHYVRNSPLGQPNVASVPWDTAIHSPVVTDASNYGVLTVARDK